MNTETNRSTFRNAQAVQMKGMVDELVTVVGGSGKKAARESYSVAMASTTGIHHIQHKAAPETHTKAVIPHKTREIHPAKEVKPDQVIPVDDDDFKDF